MFGGIGPDFYSANHCGFPTGVLTIAHTPEGETSQRALFLFQQKSMLTGCHGIVFATRFFETFISIYHVECRR